MSGDHLSLTLNERLFANLDIIDDAGDTQVNEMAKAAAGFIIGRLADQLEAHERQPISDGMRRLSPQAQLTISLAVYDILKGVDGYTGEDIEPPLGDISKLPGNLGAILLDPVAGLTIQALEQPFGTDGQRKPE